jgi:phosphomannomutase/phosphoglucomutase
MTQLFGTNGIRGVLNKDMNSTLALQIGQAWGIYLKKPILRPKCAIGTDARLSNHMLKSAVTAGFLSTGCDVIDVGLVPTPTLQYAVREKRFDAGVIITASHNPPQFNGIKGTTHDGTELTKDVEEAIEKIYFSQQAVLSE